MLEHARKIVRVSKTTANWLVQIGLLLTLDIHVVERIKLSFWELHADQYFITRAVFASDISHFKETVEYIFEGIHLIDRRNFSHLFVSLSLALELSSHKSPSRSATTSIFGWKSRVTVCDNAAGTVLVTHSCGSLQSYVVTDLTVLSLNRCSNIQLSCLFPGDHTQFETLLALSHKLFRVFDLLRQLWYRLCHFSLKATHQDPREDNEAYEYDNEKSAHKPP